MDPKLYAEEGRGLLDYPLEKRRTLAFLFIPNGASHDEAKGWLNSQFPGLPQEVRSSVLQLHLEDEILRGWRQNGQMPYGL